MCGEWALSSVDGNSGSSLEACTTRNLSFAGICLACARLLCGRYGLTVSARCLTPIPLLGMALVHARVPRRPVHLWPSGLSGAPPIRSRASATVRAPCCSGRPMIWRVGYADEYASTCVVTHRGRLTVRGPRRLSSSSNNETRELVLTPQSWFVFVWRPMAPSA